MPKKKTVSKKLMPPLSEVACEFKFCLKKENSWDASKPGELLGKVMKNYPLFEPVEGMGLQINASQPGSLPTQQITALRKYKYSNKKKTQHIILDKGSFLFGGIFNDQNCYNWDNFQKELNALWKTTAQCLGVKEIQSIGLRYINHILMKNPPSITGLLDPKGKYIPTILLDEENFGFANKSQIVKAPDNVISVTIGTFNDEKSKKRKLLLDIDNIHKEDLDITQKIYFPIIDKMHKDIEDIFFKTVSQEIKKGIDNDE